MSEEIDVLASLQEDKYRFGDIQAVLYDRKNTDLFPDGYLGRIYHLCKSSRRRTGNGILDTIFNGNPESSFDTIVSYLSSRPVIVMGKWEDGKFNEIGFAFVVITCGIQSPEKSIFAGYGFFKEYWGTEDMHIAAMLCLAMFFKESNIKAIHGIRYEDNLLTKKFTENFGFRQVGTIPYYHLRDGKLVSGVLSTLLRTDFEKYVELFLVEQYRSAQQVPVIGSEEHPAIEESRETIDAQVERLAAGQIPVVFLPFGSNYLPAIPDGIDLHVAPQDVPGAGVYLFNPKAVTEAEIAAAAKNGTHGKLLGHVHNKVDIAESGPTVVVQAFDESGVLLKDSLVPATAEAVAVQIEAFKRLFPDCKIEVCHPDKVIEARIEARDEEDAQLPLTWMDSNP